MSQDPALGLLMGNGRKVDCAWSMWKLCKNCAGRPIQPFGLKLETEHLELRASGWRTTTGLVLRQPASATVTFTPALAK